MITIRTATESDLPAMLVIYNDIIVNTTAVWDYEPHSLEMRKEWFATKQQQGFPVFVAIENDTILGFASIGTFRTWVGYRFTVENSLYIDRNSRGKGIGKLLLQKTIDAAKELKLHSIIAGIDGENEISIQLHKKLGFVEVANMKEVGYKFDRWLDLKLLELIV
ncbi:MAG: N-acetyltransferase family protein [Bacteroidota bacterium]